MNRFLAGAAITSAFLIAPALAVQAQQGPECNPEMSYIAIGTNGTMALSVGPQGCNGSFNLNGMVTNSSIVQPPANGSASTQLALYNYTPNPGFSGRDQFVMSVTMQGNGASTGTSLITVQVSVSQ